MEFVQGESLEARLQRGPLPLKQALECGIEICDALEKAHRAGIVHRDLKPGNIMLTPSGAKLLDFGLAKPVSGILGKQFSSEKGHLTPSTPTMNLSALGAPVGTLTQRGSIVGTFQFMAPEVLQGQEADARSDIFSFGCVLYEMITGKRAFEGKSQISVASAILDKEPEPITKIHPMAPAAVDHVVQECIAKDPEARWQSAADVAREMRWIASGASGVSPVPVAQPRPRSPSPWIWGAVVGALLAALLWSYFRPSEPVQTLRSFLPPPAEQGFDFTGDFSGPPALAPDGTAVAFCARASKERNSIWVQSLAELSAKKLEGTEGAAFPFWSADGKFIGFFSDGHLKKIPATGGPVTVLADTPNPRGGTWSADNIIVYEPDYRDTLWKISASGGSPSRLTKFDNGKHTTHRWPSFLPDGKHFLFFGTNHSGNSEQGVYFGSIGDGTYKHILDSDSGAQYASGYLLYHLQSQLLAQKFDPSNGKLSGDAMTVANVVEFDAGTWHTTFSASQNGLLVYEPGTKLMGIDLGWVDRAGKSVGTLGERAPYKGSGQISPDGKRLAVAMGDPEADIWVFDLVHGARTRLTFGGATHLMPSWSPDGQRIVYVRQSGSTVVSGTSLRTRLANGGGQRKYCWIVNLPGWVGPCFRRSGRLTGNTWCISNKVVRMAQVSGRYRSVATRNRSPSFSPKVRKRGLFNPESRPMDAGWPIARRNPEERKFMSLTSRAGKDAGRYRRRVVRSPRGVEIRKRFISWDLMALLMWLASARAAESSSQARCDRCSGRATSLRLETRMTRPRMASASCSRPCRKAPLRRLFW